MQPIVLRRRASPVDLGYVPEHLMANTVTFCRVEFSMFQINSLNDDGDFGYTVYMDKEYLGRRLIR